MQNRNVKSLDSFDISIIFITHIKKIYDPQTSPAWTKYTITPKQLSIHFKQTTNRTPKPQQTEQHFFVGERRLSRKKYKPHNKRHPPLPSIKSLQTTVGTPTVIYYNSSKLVSVPVLPLPTKGLAKGKAWTRDETITRGQIRLMSTPRRKLRRRNCRWKRSRPSFRRPPGGHRELNCEIAHANREGPQSVSKEWRADCDGVVLGSSKVFLRL